LGTLVTAPRSCHDYSVAWSPTRARLSWGAVWVAGTLAVAVATGEFVLAQRYGAAPAAQYVSDLVFPVGWIASGLVAWRLRPGSRIGPLMVAVGCLLLVNAPWSFRLPADLPLRGLITVTGIAGYWLALAIVAHTMLTYPSGRLDRGNTRALVVTGYVSAVIASLARLLVSAPDPKICGDRCSASPLAISQDPTVYGVIGQVIDWWFALLSLLVLLMLVRRVLTATPQARRARAVALVASTMAVMFVFFSFLLGLGRSRSLLVPYVGSYLGLLGVPAAFLIGLLQERFAYASIADLVRRLDRVEPGQIQPALAQTLGDPGLAVLFPIGAGGDYVDVHGKWTVLPDDNRRMFTPVGDDASPVAVLVHDRALGDNPQLMQAAAAAARLALE
jgi:hypothetical protein